MHFKAAFALILSLFLSCSHSSSTDDCFSDDTDNEARPILSGLLRAFGNPVQSDTPRSTNENCTELLISHLQAEFDRLQARINSLEANILLWNSFDEARTALGTVFYVYDSLKAYWAASEEATKDAVIQECRNNHPKNALILIERQATTGPTSTQLFMNIATGSRYSEHAFNETTSVLITEAAVAAILSTMCNKFLYPDSSPRAQAAWEGSVQKNLKSIGEQIEAARQYLFEGYRKAVRGDINTALNSIDSLNMERKAGGHRIYKLLNSTYPLHAWAVLIYENVQQAAFTVHVHESTNDNWFFEENGYHTTVVHGSDRSDNSSSCSQFADIVRGKKLREIIGNEDIYRDIVNAQVVHLGSIIDLLRRTLKEHHQLPLNHFISLVAYRSDLSVHRERDYHFFEHLLDPDTEEPEPVRTLLIGWC